MNYRLLLLIFLCSLALSGTANSVSGPVLTPKIFTENGQRFSLKKPVPVHTDSDTRLLGERIGEFIRSKGAETAMGAGAKTGIFIRMVERIPGVPATEKDAYRIRVTKNTIHMEVTSTKAAQWAYLNFRNLFSGPSGRVVKTASYIRGCEITDWDAANPLAPQGAVIDLIQEDMPVTRLQEKIALQAAEGKTTLYLVLISPNGWAIRNDVFRLVNPHEEISRKNALSYTDLKKLAEYTAYHGMDLIPVFDLSTNNNPDFERVTGHKMHTVEGMRFIRVLAQELCSATDSDTICLGPAASEKNKYNEEIEAIISREGKKAVYLP